MAPGDTARLYHRLSSYAGAPRAEWPTPIDHPLVRQDFAPNHRPTFPAHRKIYPDNLPSVELPAAWPPVHAPTLDLLAGRHASVARELDLEGLARLLHLSAGVVLLTGADESPLQAITGVPTISGLEHAAEWARGRWADLVVVAPGHDLSTQQARQLAWSLERSGIRLAIADLVSDAAPHRVRAGKLGGPRSDADGAPAARSRAAVT